MGSAASTSPKAGDGASSAGVGAQQAKDIPERTSSGLGGFQKTSPSASPSRPVGKAPLKTRFSEDSSVMTKGQVEEDITGQQYVCVLDTGMVYRSSPEVSDISEDRLMVRVNEVVRPTTKYGDWICTGKNRWLPVVQFWGDGNGRVLMQRFNPDQDEVEFNKQRQAKLDAELAAINGDAAEAPKAPKRSFARWQIMDEEVRQMKHNDMVDRAAMKFDALRERAAARRAKEAGKSPDTVRRSVSKEKLVAARKEQRKSEGRRELRGSRELSETDDAAVTTTNNNSQKNTPLVDGEETKGVDEQKGRSPSEDTVSLRATRSFTDKTNDTNDTAEDDGCSPSPDSAGAREHKRGKKGRKDKKEKKEKKLKKERKRKEREEKERLEKEQEAASAAAMEDDWDD